MSELDRRDVLKAGALTLAWSALPTLAAEAAETDDFDGRAARLDAAVIVENMINSYPSLQHAGMFEDILAMFALSQPDVRVDVRGVGIWQGRTAVDKAVVQIPEQEDRAFHAALKRQFPKVRFEPRSGRQFEMPLGSTVIHVAKDGNTAKVLTSAWGAQTGVTRDGKVDAFWVAEKYAVDFINESAGWKVWHFQVVPVFRTPYELNWVETARTPLPMPTWYRGALAPTKASRTPVHAYDPRPPVPYDTFAKTWSY